MCTRPIDHDGNTFACRTCDECIATRRHGWVARAMAEKAEHPHCACIALTYSDATEIGRQGARMFAYADVSAFLKRLRRAAEYEAEKGNWNFKPYVRFICAGEQGSRNGRCHWHLIIYSNFDLARVGQFRLRGSLVSHRRDMMTVGKRKRRLNWTLWPHGFMTLQEPDQGGMNYVLSYCLKDQFTEEKSKGTMREAKSELFATGLFRMSKRPAIGESWLMRKMEVLEAQQAVLPSLNLKVPGFHGYWHPNGAFREKLLWCLVALNQRIVWTRGANAPQWSALLSSCRDNAADMEILNGAQEKESPDDFESEESAFARRSRQGADEQSRRDFVRRCANFLPCDDCLRSLSIPQLAGLGVERYEDEEGIWRFRAAAGFVPVRKSQGDTGDGIHPYCQRRGSKAARLAFPRSGQGSDS